MEQPANQVKQNYIEKLGEPLGVVYHALWVETVELQARWDEYVELFGTSPERIELLNKAAAHFFGAVQNLMWNDALLHITRLTSSPKSMGKANLTIQQLPLLINDAGLRSRVEALVRDAILRAEAAKDWRNRQIAHTDFELATSAHALPLAHSSRKTVIESIQAIEKVLSCIAEELLNTSMSFDVISMAEGASHLLQIVKDGVRIRDEHHARIEAGTFTNEDLVWLSSRGKF